MAQRSDSEIQAEYDATLSTLPSLPVAKTNLVVMDQLMLEVALDTRETMNKILVLLGGTP